jgi:hypothetical protein
MTNEVGQINFWVSGGDSGNIDNFKRLYCDMVFVVASKHYWTNSNRITKNDKIVDNEQTYKHHYRWGNAGKDDIHRLSRRRYTIKATKTSFQPQDKDGNLIDILPFLNANGFSTEFLQDGRMKAGYNSKPFKIDGVLAIKLYDFLKHESAIMLTGSKIANKHPKWKNHDNQK